MTKQEAIQKAYGGHWETVKDSVDENGFISTKGDINPIELGYAYADIDIKPGNEKGVLYRPKSLSGIENNNGWIKIEPDGSNLPGDSVDYWIKTEFGSEFIAKNKPHHRIFLDQENEIEYRFITHYQPIIKPQPPIY